MSDRMAPRELAVDGHALRVAPAKVDEILPLRQRVLRIGQDVQAARFVGDEDATTRHAAVFDHISAISCATLMFNDWQGQPAWQLRGMATESSWQGRGLGGALLQYLMQWAVDQPPVPQRVSLFWCNARVPAICFYQRLGWAVASDEFDIPTAGPHRKMICTL